MRLRDLSPWFNTPPVLRRTSRRWAIAVLAVLLSLGLVLLLDEWLEWGERRVVRGVVTLLSLLPLLVICPLTSIAVLRLRRTYVKAGGRLCPHCAYNVSSLGDRGTCPECGGAFDVIADAPMWRRAGMPPR
jgi:hypothetical protein